MGDNKQVKGVWKGSTEGDFEWFDEKDFREIQTNLVRSEQEAQNKKKWRGIVNSLLQQMSYT